MDYKIIQEPDQWYILFRKILRPVSRFVQPLSGFFQGVVTLWKKQEKAGGITEEEDSQLSSTSEIPEEVIHQFVEGGKPGPLIFPDDWVQKIKNAVDFWGRGVSSNILIHGGAGTGKTGLLNHTASLYQDEYPLRRFSLHRHNPYLSNKNFIDFLDDKSNQTDMGKRQIIVVDDIEYLFLRNIEGFEYIRQLIHAIQLSVGNTLWILTANSSFYNFLKQIIPLHSVFQFYIDGDELTVDALIKIFHYTLQSTGHTFHILPDKLMLKIIRKRLRTKLISPDEVDINLKKLFLESFLSVGRGNMYFHFYYFLKAMKSVRGTKLFLTHPELPDSMNILDILSMADLHILQALFLHKNLTIEQLSETLLYDLHVILFSLQYMSHNKIISRDDDGYCINRIYYTVILKFLKTHNIL